MPKAAAGITPRIILFFYSEKKQNNETIRIWI